MEYPFEPEIIKIDQSFHNMYHNNIQNFQESTTILNAHTKKSGNLSYAPRIYIYIYIYIYILYNIITVFIVTKSLCGFVSNQVQYNMESAQYLG